MTKPGSFETLEDVPEPPPSGPVDRRKHLGSQAAFDLMMRRARNEDPPVATPWASVNRALGGGLWPGLYSLTGGTGTGKTQWALGVAIEAARGEQEAALAAAKASGDPPSPRPVIYVALELGEQELTARALALMAAERDPRTPVRWSDLLTGKAGVERITQTFEEHGPALAALPLEVEIAPPHGWTADHLASLASLGPRMVVIDFLQLIAKARGEDAREAVGRAAYQARALARDHGCVVLALSSTARANYAAVQGGDDSTPVWEREPSSLVGLAKESGEIEYACDAVFALASEKRVEGERSRRVHLALAKQRMGPESWIHLLFDGSRFTEQDPRAPTWPTFVSRRMLPPERSDDERGTNDFGLK